MPLPTRSILTIIFLMILVPAFSAAETITISNNSSKPVVFYRVDPDQYLSCINITTPMPLTVGPKQTQQLKYKLTTQNAPECLGESQGTASFILEGDTQNKSVFDYTLSYRNYPVWTCTQAPSNPLDLSNMCYRLDSYQPSYNVEANYNSIVITN